MFTGIVEKTVQVTGVVEGPHFRRLSIAVDWIDVAPGESISINGCCLTVAQITPGELAFDVIAETLDKTNLGFLAANDTVNIERSLRMGDRLSGHFVQGHIDGLARLVDIKHKDQEYRLAMSAPAELVKYLIPKGSVTLDGVSLTIAALHGDRFEVALIPTTLGLTTLGRKNVGWLFNLEADVLSKTIVSYLELKDGR